MTDKLLFLKDEKKIALLVKANQILNIQKLNINKIIFIYTIPKVGSTSLVTSFRIFFSKKYHIIHIHDEDMLKVLGGISGVTVNEIILYNMYIGKEVYVIDIYRDPIELKISTYFEKIGCFHFNCLDEQVNNIDISLIIKRFNQLFPFIGKGDHFLDTYNISVPEKFDFINKYLLIEEHGIKYIKLRLSDSHLWSNILSSIFQSDVTIVHDHESEKKVIKDVYIDFKHRYKVPLIFLEKIKKCKYFNYYHNEEESNTYLNKWQTNSTALFSSFTSKEYQFYNEVSKENCRVNYVQQHHYIDDGCVCNGCMMKRNYIIKLLLTKKYNGEKIHHQEVNSEYLRKKVIETKKVNEIIKRAKKTNKTESNLNMKYILELKR